MRSWNEIDMQATFFRLALLIAVIALAGCGKDEAVRVDNGSGKDGVLRRDIDTAKDVGAQATQYQKAGEDVAYGK